MEDLRRRVRVLEDLLREYIYFIGIIHKIGGSYLSKVDEKDIDHFGFIPSNIGCTMNTLIPLYDHIAKSVKFRHKSEIRFLDIGCGIGNVVKMAERIGFNACGLEYNAKIYKVAKTFSKRSYHIPSRVIRGDMLTFENYHEYDVLYYYQPMANSDIMGDFAKRLARKMKVGAYVIPHGTNSFKGMKSFRLVPLRPAQDTWNVYKKIKEV